MSHIGGVESSLTVSFIHSRLLLMYSRGGTWRPPVVQSFWEIEIHIYMSILYIGIPTPNCASSFAGFGPAFEHVLRFTLRTDDCRRAKCGKGDDFLIGRRTCELHPVVDYRTKRSYTIDREQLSGPICGAPSKRPRFVVLMNGPKRWHRQN